MKPRIFLSYGRPDNSQVEELYELLVEKGFSPWMDSKNLLPGERWKLAITDQIEKCDFFLACISPRSVDRRGILQEELRTALELSRQKLNTDIFLIPIRLENCDIPKELAQFQYVDLFQNDGFQKLVKAIRAGFKRSKPDVERPKTQISQEQALRPPDYMLTDEEIDNWLRNYAKYFQLIQISRGVPASQDQMIEARHAAIVHLAGDVLEGRLNFARRISQNSYCLLERVWLREIKIQLAYFNWLERGARYDPGHERDDYLAAIDHIGDLLFNDGIKAHRSEFENARLYIEQLYLTEGKVRLEKVATTELVKIKAHRILETTLSQNTEESWFHAEEYVKMFYENIIPAVMVDDQKATFKIIESFAFSDAVQNNYQVINCFEMALAIYFLNPKTLYDICKMKGYRPWP